MGEENYVASLWYAVVGGSRKAIVDLFRIEHGKLAEHWDATQESDQEQMIIRQYQFAGEAIKTAATFVKERDQLATIVRTIKDENVVLVQSMTTYENSTSVVYTMIVFNKNLVADFREVKQRIPDSMPHKNGMI
jgi:predicted SnoaL-like aldol condensation-catalyzing enzyme